MEKKTLFEINRKRCRGIETMPSRKPSLEHEIIRLEHICQSYTLGGQCLTVLDRVSLTIWRGESCAIVGAFGSGKSIGASKRNKRQQAILINAS